MLAGRVFKSDTLGVGIITVEIHNALNVKRYLFGRDIYYQF